MKRNKVIFLITSFLFFYVNTVWSKTITVDGNNTDWTIVLSSEIVTNSAIVKSGEWIWFDTSNDERRNAIYSGNGPENSSCDLTQFRVTCDDTNFYFYFQFRRLQYGPGGIVYPLIQVAMRYDEDLSGRNALLQLPQTSGQKTEINTLWQQLVCVYQSLASSTSINANGNVDIYDISSAKSSDGKYNHRAATNSNTTEPFFIEAKVPFNLNFSGRTKDISYYVLGQSVKFTVAVFWNNGAFGGTNGEIKVFEGGKSDVIDCVSVVDEPQNSTESDGISYGGTAGTWESVKDNKLKTYFDIKFDGNGNVQTNNIPQISTNTTVDGMVNNPETVISGRKPIFFWEFSDPDNDKQIAAEVQVGDDTNWTDGAEMWDVGPFVTSEELVTYDGVTLLANTTYYWRGRVMDKRGLWTDWSPINSFYTVSQAVPLNYTAKADLEIDWNNPFNPDKGQVTKIRYAIFYQDWDARILIYNINGELIRTLADHLTKEDAVYTVIWDGKNDAAELVAPGIYLVNLKVGANDILKTKRVLVVR